MVGRETYSLDILSLDAESGTPLHRQLYATLRSFILDGRLGAGSRLPATRTLAEQLGIGRNTIISAYEQLLAEGLIEARPGSGTRVVPLLTQRAATQGPPAQAPAMSRRGELIASRSQPARSPGRVNVQPGVPDSGVFPFAAWAKLVARNARRRTEDVLGYAQFAGHPRLRRAIADYLAVARGVVCAPDQVIVVTGAQAGLDLATRLLIDPGDPVWMEEPGYLGARSAFVGGGARVFPLRVGREGWNFGDASLPPPRLVYVTPSCHWPLGTIMRMEERLHLLALAERCGAWILEDDYDGEYRLRGRPVPALRGLDPGGRVVYVGTFGKTLFASLRIGFLIVPLSLAAAFERAISITGQFAPLVLQSALADFIVEGHFATHLRRMRRLYAQRQRAFVDLCNTRLGAFMTVRENDSGMQVTAHFTAPLDDRAVAEAALARGVHVQPLSINFHVDEPRQGLLLGFAALDEKEARAAVDGLAAALGDLERGPGVGPPKLTGIGSINGPKRALPSLPDRGKPP
jgi:GntR family transcriptional regulator/MocR family aminotransferase